MRVFSGPSSTFEVYDGSSISQEKSGRTTTLQLSGGEDYRDGMVLDLMGIVGAPDAVSMDGSPLAEVAAPSTPESTAGWHLDEASGLLLVRVPSGSHEISVVEQQ